MSGVSFPADEHGKRSSLAGGKLIFSAAAGAIDSALAQAIASEKNWRQNYASHIVRLTELASQSPDAAIKIAEAGLGAAYATFEFIRDGTSFTLSDAMARPSAQRALTTGEVNGVEAPTLKLELPYEGKRLTGQDLASQLNKWATYGCMEPDCASALSAMVDGGEAVDLRGKVFVVLGATSALGPLEQLLQWGGTVIGVARARSPRLTSESTPKFCVACIHDLPHALGAM